MRVTVNGEGVEISPGTTVSDLIGARLGARAGSAPLGVAAALNGEVVTRAEWGSTPVAEGDRVEVLGAIQGG
jgi:sulfur carrier protein